MTQFAVLQHLEFQSTMVLSIFWERAYIDKKHSKQRILIVDDEPDIVLLLSITLTNSGFEVITTTKGAEAIELVRREKFDVALIDIVMPDVSGFDVLDKVRSFSSVPIIVFTARTDIAESAIRFGANDSIAKPFDLDKLVEKVRLVLGKDNRG